MENAGYILVSRQTALERNLTVIANNIANLNTIGYQGEDILFQEHVERVDHKKEYSMAIDRGVVRNLAPGRLDHTGNPLDIALVGQGYVAVERDGEEFYTRNGSMRLDAEGKLTNIYGDIVLGQEGPINLPPDATDINITPDGTITSSAGDAGQLRLVNFENEQLLRKEGDNLLKKADGQEVLPAEDLKVVQNSVELSNIEAVLEMTKLIQTTRAYTNAAKHINEEHQRQLSAIRDLAKVIAR